MDINSISPIIRDSLLKRNLIFADSITQSYIQNYGSGLGRMTGLSDGTQSVPDSEDLEITGVDLRNQLLGKNRYIPNADMAYRYSVEVNENLSGNQVMGGYVTNGKINGIDDTSDMNGIINLLSGDNFNSYGTQLASKLAQEVTNKIDTNLGVIGYERLVEEMKYRTKFALEKETIGRLNLDPFDLIKGEPLATADYQITRSSSFLGMLGDKALDILGIQSSMVDMGDASVFNAYLPNMEYSFYSTSERNREIINATGKGQFNILYNSFDKDKNSRFFGKRNVYSPNIARGNKEIKENLYISNNLIDGATNKTDFYEFGTKVSNHYSLDNNEEFSWFVTGEGNINTAQTTSNTDSFDDKPYFDRATTPQHVYSNPKTLLGKTQDLFNRGIIKSLVGNKGTDASFVDGNFAYEEMATTTSAGSTSPMISKGSNIVYAERIKNKSGNPNEVFCRSWINHHRYDAVHKLQKHRGIDAEGGYRNGNQSLSVLDTNGFVKIAPYNEDPENIKRYMFSIENLAWFKDLRNLPNYEIGEGDPITKTKGRIMWFPPYDLTFSESTSVNIDTHQFIGRGEPMYTYNSTERMGSLSFKVIIDHPEWINSDGYKNEYGDDEFEYFYNSIMAGCGNLPPYILNRLTENEQDIIDAQAAQEPIVKPIDKQTAPEGFEVYFPNDVTSLGDIMSFTLDTFDAELADYEANVPSVETLKKEYAWTMYEVNGSGSPYTTPWQEIIHQSYTAGYHANTNTPYPDTKNYGLNKPWKQEAFLKELKRKLKEECPYCKVYITGYASMDGETDSNSKLSNDRANEIKKLLKKFVLDDDTIDESIRFGSNDENIVGKGETGSNNASQPVDHIEKKKPRSAKVTFVPDEQVRAAAIKIYEEKLYENEMKQIASNVKRRFKSEAEHFTKLKETDSFVFNRIKQKIKYFQPSFHSITPEGFNSRLTFLNQCTRQGSTQIDSSRPDNMVFGAPPVCILRIGDFYNTKIIIDSMSIDYEGLWDLNPEGVGVQPMIANVSLSFKFLGGSSMGGAINRLQNALSFNYYANTEIFDPRAYSISKNGDGENNGKYVQGVKEISEMINYTAMYKEKENGLPLDTQENRDQVKEAEGNKQE